MAEEEQVSGETGFTFRGRQRSARGGRCSVAGRSCADDSTGSDVARGGAAVSSIPTIAFSRFSAIPRGFRKTGTIELRRFLMGGRGASVSSGGVASAGESGGLMSDAASISLIARTLYRLHSHQAAALIPLPHCGAQVCTGRPKRC